MLRPTALPDALRRTLPALLMTTTVVATACPGGSSSRNHELHPIGDKADASPDSGQLTSADSPPQQRVNYPPMVVDYVQACLREPATDQHAALAQTWDAIAHLQDGSAFTSQLTQAMDKLAPEPPVELVAAWLSADEKSALLWLVDRIHEEKYIYFQSVEAQPDLGKILLHTLDLSKAPPTADDNALDLLRDWEPLKIGDRGLLNLLADKAEPRTRLRAIGYLLALGKASDAQLEELKEALRSHQINELAAAAEACRIARDERLAAALVDHVALTTTDLGKTMGQSQPESSERYAAYALTYLPGEQAALLRKKLLTAKDEQVQWQARLGELLQGDPHPWYDALLKSSVDNRALWLALQPAGVADPKLLLTYEQAADSENAELRLTAARHLNRYAEYASEKLVRSVLSKLMGDEVEQVGAEAWRSAALLRLDGFGNKAQQIMDDPQQRPSVRLGAAFYQLRLAEPRTEEGR